MPPDTPAQQEAIALYRKTGDESALDIGFDRGDVQFLNNHVLPHTRREYEDWPERKRRLLRLTGVGLNPGRARWVTEGAAPSVFRPRGRAR